MDKEISTLLREIKAITSWSEPRIAAELGTSQPTVNRILNGQLDCKGSTLQAIIKLHRSSCGVGEEVTPSFSRAANLAPNAGHASRQPPATNRTLGTTPDCVADLGAPP